MAWTDDRVALLKKMWMDGNSAAEVAKALGEGVTRNAVIGKAHRMGLSGRPSPIKKKKTVDGKAVKITKKTGKVAKKAVAAKPALPKKKAATAVSAKKSAAPKPLAPVIAPIKPLASKRSERQVRIDSAGAGILDLTDRMCKWPIGDPRDSDFHFCAEPSVPNIPYCGKHGAEAYQTSTRSSRVAAARKATAEKRLKASAAKAATT